jgi:DNA-binding transcriptional LysR family regulator
MLDWDDLRHFLAVYRSGTLAGAAAELQVNPTTVGRRLSGFEASLGTVLFERTTAGYVPTDAALRLLPRAEAMEEQALAVSRSVAGEDARLAGVVRITATEMLATRFLAPNLQAFRAQYPEIEIELICTSQALSLAKGEADVLLRLARPREEHLVIRRVCVIELGLYASPSYLERRPVRWNETQRVDGHETIFFADRRAFARENDWFQDILGTGDIALRSDSVSAAYSACAGGVGIALLPCIVADRDPALVRIGPRVGPQPREVWLGVHRDLKNSARIRAVLDFLATVVTDESTARARDVA